MTDNNDGADIIYYSKYLYKTCNKYEHRKNIINADEHDVVLAQSNDIFNTRP